MIVVTHPPGLEAERRYALDVVLGTILGVDHVARSEPRDDVAITVEGDERVLRVADVLFAVGEDEWLTAATLPATPLPRAAGLPLLYARPGPEPELGPGDAWLAADVFGSAFFMLTRYEEILSEAADEHGRFPATASIAAREGFLRRPIVHEYAEMLWSRMRALWPRLDRRGRTAVLRPSHDVDWPALPDRPLHAVARTVAGDLLRRRDARLALDRVRWEVARRRGTLRHDPFDTFDDLMELSEAAGVRSAFYFMTGATDPAHDAGYGLAAPRLESLLRRIHERGHEIGLHPSYGSLGRPEVVAREFDLLVGACGRLGIEQERWGGRQHYLRWENPATWRAWEEAGIDYDSTLGFESHVGFRTGACVEHPVFDLGARRALRLRERPLVVMDMALEADARREGRSPVDLASDMRRECGRFGGELTVLWHNSNLLSARARDVYRGIVLG